MIAMNRYFYSYRSFLDNARCVSHTVPFLLVRGSSLVTKVGILNSCTVSYPPLISESLSNKLQGPPWTLKHIETSKSTPRIIPLRIQRSGDIGLLNSHENSHENLTEPTFEYILPTSSR